MTMWMASIACLSIVAVACVLGVLTPAYKDNLLQRLGLAGMCLGSVAAIWEIAETMYVSQRGIFFHVALLTFAIGTSYKVAHFNALWLRWQLFRGNRRRVKDRRHELTQ